MARKKPPKLQKESDYAKNYADTEHWKMFKWIWDKLGVCPHIENVADVDFGSGTMGLVSKEGDEYTITLKKQNWREL